ncbi:NHLP bacteriocin system secretion protein [Parapusillimonas granuli]|uniref:NHLP bacteriocin system secretion protein n=1 Tax=Parapusillimonas granuli TaxID=380911 RepID=A0A853G8V9_9BURK|nr:NHLP bacteriocin system secretion protein [Parapusillimonas granuli]MBB5214276.1 biotin carboxyl carrier protein [Parapusillimonas granuli]NYT51380.1 NHLP bacteriocin system secretion protein [Parapusillimonas granuli]
MNKLFRPEALEHTAGPDQLDQSLQLIRPAHAAGIAAVLLAVVALAAWSLVSFAPVKVHGQGIILSASGVAVISAPGGGQIERILVSEGRHVDAGQAVATISRPAAVDAIEAKQAELHGVRGLLDTLRRQDADPIRVHDARLRAETLERELANFEREHERNRVVVAPTAGTAVEIGVNPGDLVHPGQTVMRLLADPAGDQGGLRAFVFVSNRDGKKIHEGMDAQVMPSTVLPQKDGFIYGTVAKVGRIPSSREGIMRRLNNATLVDTLLREGAPFEVEIQLRRAPGAGGGYLWSSGRGPDAAIDAGTMATASLIIERRRIASLVLPVLDRLLGPTPRAAQ